jgi:hypothetical protein
LHCSCHGNCSASTGCFLQARVVPVAQGQVL